MWCWLAISVLTVSTRGFHRSALGRSLLATSARMSQITVNHEGLDIVCNPVSLEFDIGNVTILEASSESQELLVDIALETSDNDEPESDPYGAVLWPSACTVANYLLSNYSKEQLQTLKLFEIGAGTGLVSLIACKAGCRQVIATDYNSLPLALLQKAMHINNVQSECMVTTLQFDVKNTSQHIPKDVDIFLVADLLYDIGTAKAVAKRVYEAYSQGATILLGDSPNRPGRPYFIDTISELMGRNVEFATVEGHSVTGERHDLISDQRSVDDQIRALDMGLLVLIPPTK